MKAGDEESERRAREAKKANEKKQSKAMKNFDANYKESAEYSTWVPPTSKLLFNAFRNYLFLTLDQSGDGTTDLNKKLGY